MPDPEALVTFGSLEPTILITGGLLLAVGAAASYRLYRQRAETGPSLSALSALILGAVLLALFGLLAGVGFLALMTLAFGTVLTLGDSHWLSWLLALAIVGGAILTAVNTSKQMLRAVRRF